MAEKYMFFNSTPDDRRRHQASDMADYWMSFLSTGLIHKDGEPFLKLEITEDKKGLYMTSGSAIINGHLYMNTDKLPIDLGTVEADTEFNVVLRWDNTIENRHIKMFVTEGGLQRTDSIYELLLYKVKKSATTNEFTPDDITDYRLDETLCGIASSLVTVPTNVFRDEWDKLLSDYYKWLQSIQNESYATLGDLRSRDYALKRELSFLNLKLDAKDRIENGTTIGADFIREPLNMKFEDAKAEVDGDVAKGSTTIKYKNKTGDWSDVKGLTVYGEGVTESVEVESYTEDTLTLKSPLSNDIKDGHALIASAVKTEDDGLVIGEVSTGQAVELNSLDLGDIYDDWAYYDDHIYMVKENESTRDYYYYDIVNSTKRKLFTTTKRKNSDREPCFVMFEKGIIVYRPSENPKESTVDYIVKGTVVDSIKRFHNDSRLAFTKPYNEWTLEWTRYESSDLGLRGLKISGSQLTSFSMEKDWANSYNEPFKAQVFSGELGYLSRYRGDSYNELLLFNESGTGIIGTISAGPDHSAYNYSTWLMAGESPGEFYQYINNSNDTTISIVKYTNHTTKVGTVASIDTGVRDNITKVMSDGKYNYIVKGNKLFKWYREKIEEYDQLNSSDIITPYKTGLELDVPFHLKDGRYAKGRFFEGVILKPLTADVRIKVPKTKEVVLYAESTGGEIEGAWFGGVPMTSKKIGDELQFVGYNENGSDQLRLRLSRESTDDTIKVTRMLGGVLQ